MFFSSIYLDLDQCDNYCFLHFTDEETETWKLSKWPKMTELGRSQDANPGCLTPELHFLETTVREWAKWSLYYHT